MQALRFTLLLIVLVLSAACDALDPEPPNPPSRERVESFIGGPIPASATELYTFEGGFQDTILWVRFDAPPADVEAFLETVGASGGLDPAWELDNLNPASDETWWQPEAAAQGAGGTYNLSATFVFCRYYADQTQAERWRIYLVCNNT